MSKFIQRFCGGFFVLDNSKLMREHMLTLRYLLSFHDPQLAHHLHVIGLGPEFYAISWFMTLFAHVFPLPKIYYLWDHLLTCADYFYMYTALSVLTQLRDQLLVCDFTSAMVLFSELGDVNVETCILDSIKWSKITPPSLFDRLRIASSKFSGTPISETTRFSFLSNKTSMLATISGVDLNHILSNSVVLDTRPIDLFKSGHLPGSIMINTSLLTSASGISTGLLQAMESAKYTILISEQEIDEFGILLLSTKQAHLLTFDKAQIGDQAITPCACQPHFYGNAHQSKCTSILN